jgi:hypothetical protein
MKRLLRFLLVTKIPAPSSRGVIFFKQISGNDAVYASVIAGQVPLTANGMNQSRFVQGTGLLRTSQDDGYLSHNDEDFRLLTYLHDSYHSTSLTKKKYNFFHKKFFYFKIEMLFLQKYFVSRKSENMS